MFLGQCLPLIRFWEGILNANHQSVSLPAFPFICFWEGIVDSTHQGVSRSLPPAREFILNCIHPVFGRSLPLLRPWTSLIIWLYIGTLSMVKKCVVSFSTKIRGFIKWWLWEVLDIFFFLSPSTLRSERILLPWSSCHLLRTVDVQGFTNTSLIVHAPSTTDSSCRVDWRRRSAWNVIYAVSWSWKWLAGCLENWVRSGASDLASRELWSTFQQSRTTHSTGIIRVQSQPEVNPCKLSAGTCLLCWPELVKWTH